MSKEYSNDFDNLVDIHEFYNMVDYELDGDGNPHTWMTSSSDKADKNAILRALISNGFDKMTANNLVNTVYSKMRKYQEESLNGELFARKVRAPVRAKKSGIKQLENSVRNMF